MSATKDVKRLDFRISDVVRDVDVLPYRNDRYQGVIVESELPERAADFAALLSSSVRAWRLLSKRGVWLKIPIAQSQFIPIAVEQGFSFHHAEREHLMLTHWLSAEENHLPPNASHQVGVGCVVLHRDGRLLLVQERNGPLKGSGVWKLPTGLAEVGEDLHVAAEREVFEETGVQAQFRSLLCFRQAHGVAFGKSDLFFVCLLEPLSEDIVPQASEIAACEWLDPEVLFGQQQFASSELFRKMFALVKETVDARSTEGAMCVESLESGFRPVKQALFFRETK